MAVNGVCLTATAVDGEARSAPTLWARRCGAPRSAGSSRGSRVNLELPLRASDRLGGHIVQGHVDGVGTVASVREDGFARCVRGRGAPAEVLRYVVEKGSIAVDGISLTVAELAPTPSSVSLIPETARAHHWGAEPRDDRQPRGRRANVEYVEGWWSPMSANQHAVLDDRGRDRGHPPGQDGRRLRRRGPRERGRPRDGRPVRHAPEAINFMAKEARGLICLALTPSAATSSGLDLMAAKNEAPLQTAFTVSIEARRASPRGSRRTTARTRSRSRSTPRAAPLTSSSPATSSRSRPSRRGAGARRPHRGRRRPRPPGRPDPGRRDLRDHERRRDDGPRARPRSPTASATA